MTRIASAVGVGHEQTALARAELSAAQAGCAGAERLPTSKAEQLHARVDDAASRLGVRYLGPAHQCVQFDLSRWPPLARDQYPRVLQLLAFFLRSRLATLLVWDGSDKEMLRRQPAQGRFGGAHFLQSLAVRCWLACMAPREAMHVATSLTMPSVCLHGMWSIRIFSTFDIASRL